jgi:hypothetical protein
MKKIIKELTTSEVSLIRTMIHAIFENVDVWDKDDEVYREDYENWLFSLDAEERNTLEELRLKF